MKIFREIAAYCSIALLAIANLSSYCTPTGQAGYPVLPRHEQSQLVATTAADLHYCLTEQHYGLGSGPTSSYSGPKQPFEWAASKPAFLNAGSISGISYFLLTKYLLIGFPCTDVIFPFHQFW